jgi:uncharacterized protein YdbL (DUF1318 family)
MKVAVGRSIGMCALALVVALGVMAAATPARADALDQAKAAGHVGERYDGYLGVVRDDAPASAKALVEDINARRKDHYARIAKEENTSVEAVAAIAGEKLVEKAPSGHYVKPGPSGLWVKVP